MVEVTYYRHRYVILRLKSDGFHLPCGVRSPCNECESVFDILLGLSYSSLLLELLVYFQLSIVLQHCNQYILIWQAVMCS